MIKLIEIPKSILESVPEVSVETHVWVTADKREIPVREMETVHIKRCIACWEGKGKRKIPPGYLGGKANWLRIFNQELVSRC